MNKPIRIHGHPMCPICKRPEKIVTEDGRIFLYWSEYKEPRKVSNNGVIHLQKPEPYCFDKPVFENKKLYAIYEDSVQVEFIDGDKVVATQHLVKGSRAKDPTMFVKDILGREENPQTQVVLDEDLYEGEEFSNETPNGD